MLTARRPRDPGLVRLRRRHWATRRLASAVLVALAATVAVLAVTRTAPSGTPVVLVSRDLPPGATISAEDVTLAPRPASDVPDGAITDVDDVVGRVLASGARPGEVLTDARVLGPSLVDLLAPGQVAVPVRVADAASVQLVRPGDRVDVVVASESRGSARLVASAATVLARPGQASGHDLLGGTSDGAGGLLVLAASSQDAVDLAGAAADGPLSLTLRAH